MQIVHCQPAGGVGDTLARLHLDVRQKADVGRNRISCLIKTVDRIAHAFRSSISTRESIFDLQSAAGSVLAMNLAEGRCRLAGVLLCDGRIECRRVVRSGQLRAVDAKHAACFAYIDIAQFHVEVGIVYDGSFRLAVGLQGTAAQQAAGLHGHITAADGDVRQDYNIGFQAWHDNLARTALTGLDQHTHLAQLIPHLSHSALQGDIGRRILIRTVFLQGRLQAFVPLHQVGHDVGRLVAQQLLPLGGSKAAAGRDSRRSLHPVGQLRIGGYEGCALVSVENHDLAYAAQGQLQLMVIACHH